MKYTIYQLTQEQYIKYDMEWAYAHDEYLCCSDVGYWWYYGTSPLNPIGYTWPKIFEGIQARPFNASPPMALLITKLSIDNIRAEICPTTYPELFI